MKSDVSNASAGEPREAMARVSGCRYRVEECFEEGTSDLGMAQSETRSWLGWHHHMSLGGLAHLFVPLTRPRWQQGASVPPRKGAKRRALSGGRG